MNLLFAASKLFRHALHAQVRGYHIPFRRAPGKPVNLEKAFHNLIGMEGQLNGCAGKIQGASVKIKFSV